MQLDGNNLLHFLKVKFALNRSVSIFIYNHNSCVRFVKSPVSVWVLWNLSPKPPNLWYPYNGFLHGPLTGALTPTPQQIEHCTIPWLTNFEPHTLYYILFCQSAFNTLLSLFSILIQLSFYQ